MKGWQCQYDELRRDIAAAERKLEREYRQMRKLGGDYFDPEEADARRREDEFGRWVAAAIVFMLGLILLTLIALSTASAEIIDMQRIAMIESSGDPKAWNRADDSRGLFQITPICLKEWNNYHPKEKYTLDDLWSPQINGRIAGWYIKERIPQMLRHYGLPVDAKHVIWAYNGGIKSVIDGRLHPITKRYFDKYGIKG